MFLSIAGFMPNDLVSHWFVFSECVLSLGVSSSLCLFVVSFAPASVPPQPVCLALFCVAFWFSGASDSFGFPVPVVMWSPFGTSQGSYVLCLLGFQGDCMWWCPFCFCLNKALSCEAAHLSPQFPCLSIENFFLLTYWLNK